MIEEYVYSASEELGGFLVIGLGIVCLVVLVIAGSIWGAYKGYKAAKGGADIE